MKTNRRATEVNPAFTHEGARAVRDANPLATLRRAVLSCMLWEKGFYESGEDVATRIARLLKDNDDPVFCGNVALLTSEARHKFHLRHVPLFMLREMARYPNRYSDDMSVGHWLPRVINRADELSEFLAMYWKDGKKPIAKQVKVGLARAFLRFDEYQLAKYDRANEVKLVDVLRMVRAKPDTIEREALWKRLRAGTLATPDTWETRMSGGEDPKAVFTDLISRGKLGYSALLRNLRKMQEAGVDEDLIAKAIRAGASKSRELPFRFIAAAKAAPRMEAHLDWAMQASLHEFTKLPGTTVALVDVSGSMFNAKVSEKSELTRFDAAAALAMLLSSVCEKIHVIAFSTRVKELPPRTGMGLYDVLLNSMPHASTFLGEAVAFTNAYDADRLIVFTDEESEDEVPAPAAGRGYMVNVAGSEHSVGYGPWVRLNGFSEHVVRYIQQLETEDLF